MGFYCINSEEYYAILDNKRQIMFLNFVLNTPAFAARLIPQTRLAILFLFEVAVTLM
jgi:hypothetical protein